MIREYKREISLNAGTLYGFADVSDIESLKHYDKWAVEAVERLENLKSEVAKYRKALFEHVQRVELAQKKLVLEILRRTRRYGKPNEIYYYISVYYVIAGVNGTQKVLDETYSGKDWRKAVQRFNELKKAYPQAEIKDYSKR